LINIIILIIISILTFALWCKNFSPVFLSWMYNCKMFVQYLCAESNLWSDTSTWSPMIESKFENSMFKCSDDVKNLTYNSDNCIRQSNILSKYAQWSFNTTDLLSRSTLVSASMYVNGGKLVEFTNALMSIPRDWKIYKL